MWQKVTDNLSIDIRDLWIEILSSADDQFISVEPDEIKSLIRALEDALEQLSPTPPKRTDREVVETKLIGHITYQLERVYCGKKNCHTCPHGPYWYAYYRVAGRVVSKYVGKKFKSYVTHQTDYKEDVT
jgi:hypothetical protein